MFKQKVLIHQIGTISQYTSDLPLIHHPSDIFHFGLTEDLLKIWTNHPIPDDVANFFTQTSSKLFNPCLFNHQFTPEQYIWLVALDKNNIRYKKPDYYFSMNETMKEEQNWLFLSNFIILDEMSLGIKSKFDLKLKKYKKRFYSLCLYVSVYKKLFGEITEGRGLINYLRYNEKIDQISVRIEKHEARVKVLSSFMKKAESKIVLTYLRLTLITLRGKQKIFFRK